MAYQAPYLTEEDKKKQDADAGRPTSGVVDGTTSQTGSGVGPVQNATEAKTPGTGFVNLQQYLDMNKGEGGRLAGDSTKDLTSKADTIKDSAKSTVTQAAGDFSKATGTDAASALKSGLQTDAEGTKGAAADFLGAGYGGPTAADKAAGIKADAKDLSGAVNGFTDADGKVHYGLDDASTQQAALAKTYGAGGQTYTPGFGLLDRFLIGGTDSGRQKIADVKSQADSAGTAVKSAADQLVDQEADARKKLEENKKSVLDTAAETQKNILSEAQKKAQKLSMQNMGKEGGQDANIADALAADTKKRADLEALAELHHADKGDWYKGTFQAGNDIPESIGGNATEAAARTKAAVDPAMQKSLEDLRKELGGPVTNGSIPGLIQTAASKPTLNNANAVGDAILGPFGPTNTHRVEGAIAKDAVKEGSSVPQNPTPSIVQELVQKPELPKSLLPLSPALKAGKKLLGRLSDAMLKENVEPISKTDMAEFFGHIQPYFYTYINQQHGEGVHPGFMAQDLLKSRIGRTIVSEVDGCLTVDTWKLLGALTLAMKFQSEGK